MITPQPIQLAKFFQKHGQKLLIPNHYRILVEDEMNLYFLEKGNLDCFMVDVLPEGRASLKELATSNAIFTPEKLEGHHTFFKEFSSGRILFSFSADLERHSHMVARANGNCTLWKIKVYELMKLVKETPALNRELREQLKLWLHSFNEMDCKTCQDFSQADFTTSEFWSDLALFQQQAVKILDDKTEEHLKKQSEYTRLSREIDVKNFENSLTQLQNILDNEIFTKEQETDVLFRTCQFVGGILNLKWVVPKNPRHDLPVRERLGNLCFDSHVYYRTVKLKEGWWKRNIGPLIGFYGPQERPVALVVNNDQRYEMLDLMDNKKILVNQGIDEKLALDAVMFYRAMPDKKVLSGTDVIRFGLADKGRSLVLAFLFGGLGILLALFFPYANNILFNLIIPYFNQPLLLQLTIGMILVAMGSSFFILIRECIILRFQALLTHDLQMGVWQRLFDLPARFFKNFEIGDLILRAFSVDLIRQRIAGPNLRVIINSVFAFFYLIPMFYYSPFLALVGLGIGSVGFIFSIRAMMKTLKGNRKIYELQGEAHALILQFLFGISKIRIAGAENVCFVLWEKIFYQIKKLQWPLEKVMNGAIVTNFSIARTSKLVIYAAALFWIQTNIATSFSVGHFIAFIASFMPFSIALNDLCLSFVDMGDSLNAWNRGLPLFQQPPEVDKEKTLPGELTGSIHVDHVSFRYDNDSPPILEDITFHVDPGEFVAIVGSSGSGKSTFIRLLIGFETPDGGAIYYDGKDLANLDVRQVRRQIGVVLQTSMVLSGTLRENIITGGFYTEEEIFKALELAGFTEDLKRLPMGLGTIVTNDGATFSGGQKQRIIIARALVSRPKIVIFDEATSALDNKTQDIVTTQIAQLKCTRIVIAHRLATIKTANRIYVFDKGRVVETGTFEELVQKKGFFHYLLTKQKFD